MTDQQGNSANASTEQYRNGLICEVDGQQFWHTGAQYWIAIGKQAGNQIDLRTLPGFDRIEQEHKRNTSFRFSQTWINMAEEDPFIFSAIELLEKKFESIWWDAVGTFLQDHIMHERDMLRARGILLTAGFNGKQVARLLD